MPSTAFAEFFVVPFAGIKFGGSTSIVDLELAAGKKKAVLGVSAMFLDSKVIGYEVEFANIAGFFANDKPPLLDDGEPAVYRPLVKPGSYVSDFTGSVVLSLPPGATGGGLRPYVVVGGGLIHAQASDFLEIFQIRRTVPAINIGVGAIGLLTNNVGVRFDVRHLRSLAKDASSGLVGRRIAYTRLTFGLLLRL